MTKNANNLLAIIASAILCIYPVQINAYAEETVDLEVLASSLGADTDFLNIVNYYPDQNRPAPKECYTEFVSKANNYEFMHTPNNYNYVVSCGHCAGISIIEVLCHNGVISPSDVQKDAKVLSDVVYTEELNKILTSYQTVQIRTEYDLYDHYYIASLPFNEQVERLLSIANKAMKEKQYFLLYFQNDTMSHAITGIGITDGSWTFKDKTYDKCILTHDSNGADSEGNTGFNTKGCVYINSETNHVYIPAYDIDSESEMVIGAIDDTSLLNYKGIIKGSDSINSDISSIHKVIIGSPNFINYDLSFIGYDGKELPLGDYLLDGTNQVYLTKAGNIISKTNNTAGLSDASNIITIQNLDYEVYVTVYHAPSVVEYDDSCVRIKSVNKERLSWGVTYSINNFFKNSDQYQFILSGKGGGTDISVSMKDNGFLLEGDLDGNYGISSLGPEKDETGNRTAAFGNQYLYEFNTSQNVYIAYDDNNKLALYTDVNGDGVYNDKIQNGDVNCDNSINAADATEILSKYSEISTSNDIFTALSAIYDSVKHIYLNYDYNNDGKIDAADATDVLVEYATLSTS